MRERTLLEFELSYERALTDRAQRLAKLEELIGQEIPGDQSSNTGMESEQPE